ncbi:MAG TPA: DUF58 domain-containing protein [Verrucomicrobia bacterium]|nr:MAG: hypothetical protein A2X46_11080 [Lentisphaerae bacterium GWF2_57_35]HBA86340.1 DUF58 domain-containing protein [Verrucomicrobiota bacterium]
MIPKEILKKVRQIQIRTRHMVSDVFAGQYQSVFKGQGMEFHEVREYVPGDEIRTIDWNVTARTGHPFVKKFVEERELTVMLLVDISGSNQFGSTPQLKKDLAAELAAILAFSAIKNNDRVGLILFSDEIECYIAPRKGASHVLRVIRETLYFQPRRKGTKILPALDFLNHVTNRKTVAFLISDFQDVGFERSLMVTAKRHDLIGVTVADRRESSWPSAGVIEWEDAETGARHLIDTSDAQTRRVLETLQAQRRKELLSMFRSAGVDSVEVFAGEPYEKALIRFFRQRERRLRV